MPRLHVLPDSVSHCSTTRIQHSRHQMAIQLENSFFVGWGTLSLINAGLAQSKGRSGLVWWLISIVAGPLATLLIVVMGRGNTPPS